MLVKIRLLHLFTCGLGLVVDVFSIHIVRPFDKLMFKQS